MASRTGTIKGRLKLNEDDDYRRMMSWQTTQAKVISEGE